MESHAPMKPKKGRPCVGCGFCCAAEVCKIGQEVYGHGCPAPCPGMKFDGQRFVCIFVAFEAFKHVEPLLAKSLGIGKGCDADDPDTQQP